MTTLNGSSTPIDLEPGYTLSAPGLFGQVEITSGRDSHARNGGIEQATFAFDEALKNAGINEIRTISLEVHEDVTLEAPATMRTAEGEDGMLLDIPDLGETVGQVVLAIDNGVVTWNFPQDRQGNLEPSTSRGVGNQKRFIIRKHVPIDSGQTGYQSRGLFGSVTKKILKILVYPISDAVLGPIGKHFARKWEEKKRPYNIRPFTPENYTGQISGSLSKSEWANLTTGRALLFIHGTFSISHAGFGKLPKETINKFFEAYGNRVFAFDHFTMSADPKENMNWFLKSLSENLPAGKNLDVDIVCHSRGGLVSRLLSGETKANNLDRIRVGKVIFVATPNQGTLLANPKHMVEFIDRYTSGLNIIPPGPATVVIEILEALLTVVKVIGHAGLSGLDGLAAMDPSGDFIKSINNGSGVSTNYYGISSDYEPTGTLREFIKLRVADMVVDRVFQSTSNDLVVPTDGVNQGSHAAGFPLPEDRILQFSSERNIWHTDYFGQEEVSDKLQDWLLPI